MLLVERGNIHGWLSLDVVDLTDRHLLDDIPVGVKVVGGTGDSTIQRADRGVGFHFVVLVGGHRHWTSFFLLLLVLPRVTCLMLN